MASGIAAEGAWDRLPVLADALGDADCEDELILNHLRHCEHAEGKFPNRNGGCFEGTCWVIQEILQRSQRVLARYSHPGTMEGDYQYAPVLNPGSDVPQHRVWVVVPTTWAGGPEYAVEASTATDAEDEFIDDDDFGGDHRIQDDDLKDYMTDKGEWGDNPKPPEYSCSWTGSGKPYDTQDIYVYGQEFYGHPGVRYFGPGIPYEGVTPKEYNINQWPCVICDKQFYILDDRKEQVCSPECEAANNKILAEVES